MLQSITWWFRLSSAEPERLCHTFVAHVLLYSILFVYIYRIGVFTSSARAGPEEGSRLTRWRLFGKISGEPPGAVTLLRRERSKPVGNGWAKALSVMK